MWNRLRRLFRSIFGGLIDSAEDPELILQQVIRDMRDKVPQMNNNVAQVMANEKLLGRNVEQMANKITELDGKVKAAIKLGRDDIATSYLGELQSTQKNLEATKLQMQQAKLASEKAIKFRDNYLLQMKRKSDEAMQLIAASKQARMQEQLAQTMTSFQVGDDSATFDDMREKISRRAAAAEAKAELATSGVDSRMQEIEAEVATIEAQDMLLAYKRQMGLLPEAAPPALGEGAPSVNTEKTLGAAESAPPERGKALE
ncbi:MAG TPA: PspA/IM30 family protein [Blastocatellia bacterium]|jgi:phage shock protein A|nr:PspA/IM30 family protein [Blastocatellia bacterium]